MSFNAVQVYSINGFFKEVKSWDIHSREHARKIGPFVDENNKLMFWVKPSYDEDNGRRKRRPYFSHYSINNVHKKELIMSNIKVKDKNSKHSKAQKYLTEKLTEKILSNEQLIWSFIDSDLSDIVIKGNLLKEVEIVKTEYEINLKPLGQKYIFDIALLGKKINNERVILGAIEIENTHEADLIKTLLCKSIGFPLITLDITDLDEKEINPNRCMELLLENCNNSEDSRRRNYFYIHNLLLPIYTRYIPKEKYKKHQYIVFFKKLEDRDRLIKYLEVLKEKLNIDNNADVNIVKVNINLENQSSISTQKNETELISENIEEYNKDSYLRIILKKPFGENSDIYIFHVILCKLLALYFDCLVGYKYMGSGLTNYEHSERFWIIPEYKDNKPSPIYKKLCPKELSEPIYKIVRMIQSIE